MLFCNCLLVSPDFEAGTLQRFTVTGKCLPQDGNAERSGTLSEEVQHRRGTSVLIG